MADRLQGVKEGYTLQSYLVVSKFIVKMGVLELVGRLQWVKEGFTPRSYLGVNESIVKMGVLELVGRLQGCQGAKEGNWQVAHTFHQYSQVQR